jgi:hypothetical protein
MSLDFYDARGRAFAYSEDGETIYTFSGKPIGYIDRGSVYSFGGKHVGFFEDGQIWDATGKVVLFTQQASGGPIKPRITLKPQKRLKHIKPSKCRQELQPRKVLHSLTWSRHTPEYFFDA